jgi:hypothetical protein
MTQNKLNLLRKAMTFCKESENKTEILNYIQHEQTNQTKNDRIETIQPRTEVQRNHDRQGTQRGWMV